jgi:hypothetical protein
MRVMMVILSEQRERRTYSPVFVARFATRNAKQVLRFAQDDC